MTRLVLLAVVCAALMLAGCAKKTDEPPADTNSTATSTPTGASANGTGANSSTSTSALPAKDVCSPTFDFTPGPPAVPPDPNAVQNPTQTRPCAGVPAGYKVITLKVTWALGAPPAFVGQAAPVVKLVDPAKSAIATCTGPSPGDQTAPKPCEAKASGAPVAGDYQVVGVGSGTASAKALVSVT